MPEGYHDTVAPVDEGDAFLFLQGSHDVTGYFLRGHQHGIVLAIVQQAGGHESGPDVGEADGEMLHASQLFQGVDVDILETLGGGVGRGGSQSFGSGNGADDGEMSSLLPGKITERRGDHPYESRSVGLQCLEFDVRCQCVILMANA